VIWRAARKAKAVATTAKRRPRKRKVWVCRLTGARIAASGWLATRDQLVVPSLVIEA
jgi:hypothetical protein